MEMIEVAGSSAKVYELDKKRFSLAYLPHILLFTALYIIIMSTQIFVFILSSLENIVYPVIADIIYTGLIIINTLKVRSMYKESYVQITGTKNEMAKYDVFRSTYEADYSINSINSIKITPFSIIVRGDIDCRRSYFESRPGVIDTKKKRLRIPACYESMDEIYSELGKMKGQA